MVLDFQAELKEVLALLAKNGVKLEPSPLMQMELMGLFTCIYDKGFGEGRRDRRRYVR